MNKAKSYTEADMAEVRDNPEWTAEDFKKARPFSELFPELSDRLRRRRGKQKAPTKKQVSLRIDPDVLEWYKSSGPGWQGRINDVLRKAAGLK